MVPYYLQRFGAGYRVDAVNSVNTPGGSFCTYCVILNEVAVPVTATNGAAFRYTLSAGDRNTLALAFFFASREQHAQLANAVVVIDDTMTSLDEHRSVATVQQIRLLLARVRQVIILSHFKSYLCEVWKGATSTNGAPFWFGAMDRDRRSSNGTCAKMASLSTIRTMRWSPTLYERVVPSENAKPQPPFVPCSRHSSGPPIRKIFRQVR